MTARKARRAAILAVSVLLVTAAACTRQQAVETLGRTAEGTARAVCAQAGNCQNSCPDGSIAQGPFYRCP